ncbi:hypothetical protein PX699_28100 [Sphingobium sp. H39-3-25]|nr:hypothetical protein [Sphingobium arseniciresistens]
MPQWRYDAAMVAADGVVGNSALSVSVRQMGSFAPGRPATGTLAPLV